MKFSNILKGLNTKSKWNLFIPGLQGLFNIGALINIKHHINRMKEKNMIISVDTKIQYPSMIKAFRKPVRERNVLNIIKAIY